MNEAASQAVETVMNSPKVAAVVATATSAGGAAYLASLIQGWLSVLATAAGLVLTIVLISNHMLRKRIMKRELDKLNEK